jgi:hypothetical protein
MGVPIARADFLPPTFDFNSPLFTGVFAVELFLSFLHSLPAGCEPK